MYPQDRIRFHLLAARKLSDAGRRDETIAGLLAEALTEANRTGDATDAPPLRLHPGRARHPPHRRGRRRHAPRGALRPLRSRAGRVSAMATAFRQAVRDTCAGLVIIGFVAVVWLWLPA